MSHLQHTFDLPKTEELATLARALDLLMQKDVDGATKVLIARHDQLTASPALKLYDPREGSA